MFKPIFLLISIICIVPIFLISAAKPFVTAELMGQLGNQMFQIAAATSLALDHNAIPIFPSLVQPSDPVFNFKENYEKVLFRVKVKGMRPLNYTYREPRYSYVPIQYRPNMKIFGWFQSERYFAHHRAEILQLFAPSAEIMDYLKGKYEEIINHPKTVSIHYRSYLKEDPEQKAHNTLPLDYFKKAITLFPEDALFVVFSNKIGWCKKNFAAIPRKMVFIEGEKHYHDLFLMSLCKNNIVSNSSFSWWGAYLNQNPDKIVVAPTPWFNPAYCSDTGDLIPKSWITIQ
jgi:Glycosyl transferase family 11